jgi:hypothetical protein
MDWRSVYENLAHVPHVQESASQFSERLEGAYPRNLQKNLTAFAPDSIVEQPASHWTVWGCATIQGKGKRRSYERWMVIAALEQGGWHFTELLPAAQLDAKKPMPCVTKHRR